MSPEWQAAAGQAKRSSAAWRERCSFFSRHGDGDDVRVHLNRESHRGKYLRRADPRCIEEYLHSVVSHFALWLDSLLQSGALKLFDEVLLKQRAATVFVR